MADTHESVDYRVNLHRLKIGGHAFEFKITDALFTEIPNAVVKGADARAKLYIQKSEKLYDVAVEIDGDIRLECDRCLEEYPYPLSIKHRIILSHDESLRPLEGEEVVYLPPNLHFADFKQDFYDLVTLQVPYRKVPCDSLQTCPLAPEAVKNLVISTHLDEDELQRELEGISKQSLADHLRAKFGNMRGHEENQ